MLSARLYLLGGLAIALLAGLGWGGHRLYRAGYDAATAQHLKEAQLVESAAKKFEVIAANAISTIQVKHVTIRQNLEKELTRDVVYRDCMASDRVFELSNEAITGRSDSATDSVVSAPEPINER